jgi:hypothetical protein
MEPPYLSRLAISVEKQGPASIRKASFPLRYGTYSEIRTGEYEFRFNLNGEIKFIRGLNPSWPHPAEQLKRTDGNDWVYYSVGDDSSENGVISWIGEYYLPCLPYPSNSIWEINYFSKPDVMNAFAAWPQLYGDLYASSKDQLHSKARELTGLILANHDGVLHERSQRLNEIIGGRLSVLPPDTRHVDYEIVPLAIADGCLYHCNFCCVQSANGFRARSRTDIQDQVRRLKEFYGRNLENYNGLFLGNHDALEAGEESIVFAASESYKAFGFGGPKRMTPLLFLFGSVHSLLNSNTMLLETLNQLPFYTYINIGFESVDAPTLAYIGKPVNASKVREAFERMLEINANYSNLEVTGNFIMGEQLSPGHYQSLGDLLQSAAVPSSGKGAVYLSALKDSPKKRELLPRFHEMKKKSNVPVFIYLIQRL